MPECHRTHDEDPRRKICRNGCKARCKDGEDDVDFAKKEPQVEDAYQKILAFATDFPKTNKHFVVYNNQIYMAAVAAATQHKQFVTIAAPGEGKTYVFLMLA